MILISVTWQVDGAECAFCLSLDLVDRHSKWVRNEARQCQGPVSDESGICLPLIDVAVMCYSAFSGVRAGAVCDKSNANEMCQFDGKLGDYRAEAYSFELSLKHFNLNLRASLKLSI